MGYHNYYLHQFYHPYRAKELQQRADQEQLALIAAAANHPMRFYYPALVRVGRWLMASGLHLQKRYGELCELPAVPSQTTRHA